ncbi:hypothetical protein NL490_28305, partial [Klebsiella pneumoniae]|nr:hypothetical protein [Klebsiella pneumoniae]
RKRVDPDKDGRDETDKDESGDGKDTDTGSGTGQVIITESQKTRFYGSVRLDAIRAKMDFANIMDEVVQNFASQYGVE